MNTTRTSALSWEELENQLRRETPEEWSQRTKEASPNKFNQIKLILSRFATDSQIRSFFEILSREMPNKGHLTRLLSNKISNEGITRWEKRLKQRAPSFFSTQSNYSCTERDKEDHQILQYTIEGTDPTQTRTIIGFTGNGGMLMAPTACILATLSTNRYNLIVIRRRYKGSYFDHKGRLLNSIYNHLQSILNDQLENSIILGTSSGGLAALYSTHALRLPLGIAFGAKANENTFSANGPIDEISQENFLQETANNKKKANTNLILVAGANHKEDREGVRLISNYFKEKHPNTSATTELLFRGCNDHHIPSDLARIGISLEQVLNAILQDKVDSLSRYLKKDDANGLR